MARAGGEILVVGHTDRQGTVEANDALSLKRAQAIVDLLTAQGFARELITARGRGEREPLVPTADEVAALGVYLCSEAASGTSGAAMRVDGGVVNQIM